ncbi:MAG: hypothetical protein PHN56_07435 [Candidatus Nanoarchaeia archaeon]|nr:hypothetical protein [Candidatus Nanoarchaeia archaeon]
MIEDFFIKDLAKPFYEMMGEKALVIIYDSMDEAMKKHKIIETCEKNGFNSKIVFKKEATEEDKITVFSFLAKKCYEEYTKQVGIVAKPMMDFILSNYKEIKI